MVRLMDDALRSLQFGQHASLASPTVTLADPATGTGTFILGVIVRIAETIQADEGKGSVKALISAAVNRLIAFEMQLGPFAVAHLRILAEINFGYFRWRHIAWMSAISGLPRFAGHTS